MATRPGRVTRPPAKTRPVQEERKKLKPAADESDDDSSDEEDSRAAKKKAPVKLQPKWKPKGGQGFRVSFEMPFRAKDLFNELCKPEEPLGFDKETATVAVVRPGSVRDKVFSVGFVRKSTFKNKFIGNTSSELIELEENKEKRSMRMTWKVLTADMPFSIRGNKRQPECTIEIKQERSGSQMAFSWDYEYTHCMAPLCCLAPLAPCVIEGFVTRSLKKPDNIYKDQMVDRGYSDINEQGATRLQALAKAFAVRRAEARRKANKPVYDDDDDDDAKDKRGKDKRPPKRGGAGLQQATAPSRPTRDGGGGGEGGEVASRPTRPIARSKTGGVSSATTFKPRNDAPLKPMTRPTRGVQFGGEKKGGDEEAAKKPPESAKADAGGGGGGVKVIDDSDEED